MVLFFIAVGKRDQDFDFIRHKGVVHYFGAKTPDLLSLLSALLTSNKKSPHAIPVLLIKGAKQDVIEWLPLFSEFHCAFPHVFQLCIHEHEKEAQSDAQFRLSLFKSGLNMVTFDLDSIFSALDQVNSQQAGFHACLHCGMHLTEDSLWAHNPLYHVNLKNPPRAFCPICQKPCTNGGEHDPYAVHLRNAHGPCARGELISEYDLPSETLYAFALVVCIQDDGSMLLVHEFASNGFWLPGGRVDPGETLQEAARRECLEEAGVLIELTGVLKVEITPSRKGVVRMRVVFLAKPTSRTLPKSVPDFESCGATWASFTTIRKMHLKRQLRGSEPKIWADYLSRGGTVHSLEVLGEE